MEIKICRIEDGPARIEVVDPSVEPPEVTSCTDLNVGEEVIVKLPDVHSVGGVQVGEVQQTPQGTGEGQEAPQDGTEGGSSEGADRTV